MCNSTFNYDKILAKQFFLSNSRKFASIYNAPRGVLNMECRQRSNAVLMFIKNFRVRENSFTALLQGNRYLLHGRTCPTYAGEAIECSK